MPFDVPNRCPKGVEPVKVSELEIEIVALFTIAAVALGKLTPGNVAVNGAAEPDHVAYVPVPLAASAVGALTTALAITAASTNRNGRRTNPITCMHNPPTFGNT